VTELIEYRPRDPAGQLVAWADAAEAAFRLAESLVRTNVCPPAFRGKPQEATAVILLGAEVGLSPIAALRAMFEIRGQLGMYVRAQVALCQSRGHRIWTEIEEDDRVVVKGHRAGDPEHVETSAWTLDRARRAGFIRRGANNAPSQYELQPRAMLWARAAGDVARRIAADVLAGIPELDDPPEAGTGERAAPPTVIQRQPRQVSDVELPPLDENLVPLAEVSRRLSRHEVTLRRDFAAGRIPAVQVGGRWYMNSDVLDRIISGELSVAAERPEDDESSAAGQESPKTAAEPQATLPLDLPEPEEPPPADDEPAEEEEPLLTDAQLRKLQVLFVRAGVRGPEARHAYLSRWLERPVEASNQITVTEASDVIDRLERQVQADE